MPDLQHQLQAALGSAYTLERELGGGGMSRVFLATETALGRKVVIKVLPPDRVAGLDITRFRREIQFAAQLQQAQIVPVLTAGEIDGLPYYTMPFVDGESLRPKLSREGALPIADVISILRDVTRALAFAHERGVVHRDIKPDNVLLSGGTAVVTDFGIARALTASMAPGAAAPLPSLTETGVSVGTPAYASPEQASGNADIDHRADIYSLGCLAYEMLSGGSPFAGRTAQQMFAAHLVQAPEPVSRLRPDTPPVLADIVMRCLEKDPAARPQAAGEVAAALDAALTGASRVFAGPGSTSRGLLVTAAGALLFGLCAKAAVVVIGLPDWVMTGALAIIAAGIAAAALTAWTQHASRRAARYLTWRRTVTSSAVVVGAYVAAVGVVMVLRAFGVGPAASLMAAGAMGARERVIVADVAAGADSSLSHVITEAVRTGLGESRAVSVVPPAAIAAALQRMQRPASTALDLATARELALREGVKAIVIGEITPLGTGHVLAIRLVTADSGSELAAYRASLRGTDELLGAIDDLTRKLRGRIGESLRSVRSAPALARVTTGSLDALRRFAEAGRASNQRGDFGAAVRLLREAVALDTTFASAYRALGIALGNWGMPRAQADSALARAYEFRDRLPEQERYMAVAAYFMSGPGLDRQKAAAALEQALRVDSTNAGAAGNLAGIWRSRREFARAESLYAAVNASPGASQLSIGNQAATLLADGKVAGAEAAYKDLQRRFPSSLTARTYTGLLLYVHGELDSAEAFWRARRSDPDAIVRMASVSSLSSLAFVRGRLREGQDLAREAETLNAARGATPRALGDALTRAGLSIWLLDARERGVRTLDSALAATPLGSLPVEGRPYFNAAVLYAWAGRPDKSRAMLRQFDAEVREAQVRRAFEPARRIALAEIALAEKRPLDAVRELWASDSAPDGPSTDCTHCIDLDLGRAFDGASLPDSAIAHWERYLADTFSRRPARDGIHLAVTLKRLGELYEARSDWPKAEESYSRFVELWKRADPELQASVQEVRRRLAAIRTREKR